MGNPSIGGAGVTARSLGLGAYSPQLGAFQLDGLTAALSVSSLVLGAAVAVPGPSQLPLALPGGVSIVFRLNAANLQNRQTVFQFCNTNAAGTQLLNRFQLQARQRAFPSEHFLMMMLP